jgi:hypothetical protein
VSYKTRLVESHALLEEEHRLREELVEERLRAMGYIQ